MAARRWTAGAASIALAGLFLGAVPTWSSAQSAPPAAETGVAVTPARVEEDLTARTALQRLSYTNGDSVPREVTLEVAPLGHDVLGTPDFDSGPRGAFAIQGPTEFLLAPGESRDVMVDIDFNGSVATYGAVLATIDGAAGLSGDVGLVNRVAALFLLRGPGPWDQTLELADVGIATSEDGTEAVLLIDVKNVGDAHVRAVGNVVVSHEGQPIALLDLVGENVIPGYARRQHVAWVPPPGLEGDVDVVVRLDGQEPMAQTIAVGMVAEAVTQSRADNNLAPGGATFGGVESIPAPLSLGRLWWPLLLALVLLLFTARQVQKERQRRAAENDTGTVD